jgi:hypothetical protein
MTAKEQVIELVNNLPDTWSVEEIEYYLYMKKRIERSVHDIRERHQVTHYDLRRQVDAWKHRLLMHK